MYRRIVVPLDGSAFGDHAIGFAAAIARRAGAHIELIHVHVPHHREHDLFGITPFRYEGVAQVDQAVDEEWLRNEDHALHERARQLAEETGLDISARVLRGRIDAAVEHEAYSFGADLIVMATHARTGLERLRLGSVAEAVVRHSSMPVLLVRPGERPDVEAALPAFRKVLVPVDGSHFSEQVLPAAMDMARLFDADISFLHVELPAGERFFSRPSQEHGNLTEQTRRVGEHYLQDLVRRAPDVPASPHLEVTISRFPPAAILAAARRLGADLIAMATHGRGGLTRLVIGSTAGEILANTHTPVLLLRPRRGAHSAEIGSRTGEMAV